MPLAPTVAAARLARLALLARAVAPALAPVATCLVGLAASFLLWRALEDQQVRRVHRSVQSELAAAAHQLEADVGDGTRALGQVARHWDALGDGRARREAAAYAEARPGCAGVARVGPGDAVHWVDETGAGARTVADLGGGPALGAALREGTPALCYPLRSAWGGTRTILLFAPHEPGSPRGGLVAVLRADRWIDAVLHANVAAGYALAVTDGAEEVYARRAAEDAYRGLEQSLPVDAVGRPWRLHAWPTPEVVEGERTPLPALSLAVGLLATTLLTLAAAAVRATRRHAADLEREIREREAAQGALQRSEALHRSLTENLDQGVYLKDRDGRFLAANPAFCRLVGRGAADVVGRTEAELFAADPDAAAHAADDQRARAEGRAEGERTVAVAGAPRVVRYTLTLLRDGSLLGLTWDVTEWRAVEAQYRQAQKMEAFGQLAGGVAHDFNNLLTVINGFTDLLLEGLPAGGALREAAGEVRNAGERAAALTAQLLAFSRKSIVEPKVLDLNDVVAQVGKMLGRLIGADVVLATDLADGLHRVRADRGQVEQVVVNLAVNARDAMPRGGRLTVRTRNVEVAAGADRRPGRYAELAVSDTGTGMTDGVRAKLFEPFFTTKGVGQGTGLGLATVHGIVSQAGGHVGVETKLGEGTTFSVLLPAVDGPDPRAPGPRAGAGPGAPRGSELVLLVEDELAVRRLARAALEGVGYRVLEAASGAEAVRIADGCADPIDLLVTDVVMPGMGGRDVAAALRARRPVTRVLFVSGYTDGAIVPHGVDGDGVAFLQKPYTPRSLARKVRAVLDGLDGLDGRDGSDGAAGAPDPVP
ncbi:ATP-binding protein [Gemmata sp.]|uniref:hybrid sensor histidine kinase/response regulator n=1 Tax=Gemmata sp. TaxID=1914242 RepID=UPI003F70509B